jgi:hypothetical protein
MNKTIFLIASLIIVSSTQASHHIKEAYRDSKQWLTVQGQYIVGDLRDVKSQAGTFCKSAFLETITVLISDNPHLYDPNSWHTFFKNYKNIPTWLNFLDMAHTKPNLAARVIGFAFGNLLVKKFTYKKSFFQQ